MRPSRRRHGSIPHIHLRPLFHWTGWDFRDLKGPARVEAYVDRLRSALVYGLWMLPRPQDNLALQIEAGVVPASVCFTENRLSDSKAHAERFGKLGLGFTKKFVIELGGHPVMYVNTKSRTQHASTALQALRAIARVPEVARGDVERLAQFFKAMHQEPEHHGVRPGRRPPRVDRVPDQDIPTFPRKYGRPFVNQGEAEWRVIDVAQKRVVDPQDPRPGYDGLRLLKFEVGTHLSTIIFPDRRTYMAASEDKIIQRQLRRAKVSVNLHLLDELGHL